MCNERVCDYTCPHTTIHVSSYYYRCVHLLLEMVRLLLERDPEDPTPNHQETDSSKQARASIPPPNATRSSARAMSQDYPFTGPSPGTNQHTVSHTYPSSLPPARGNLLSNVSPKRHSLFPSSVYASSPWRAYQSTRTCGTRSTYPRDTRSRESTLLTI